MADEKEKKKRERGKEIRARYEAAKDAGGNVLKIAPRKLRPPELQNYTTELDDEENEIRIGKTIPEMARELFAITGGWPKRGPAGLFIDHRGEIITFEGKDKDLPRLLSLYGYHLDFQPNRGRSIKMLSRVDFLFGLLDHAERFESIETEPHYPLIKTSYYTEKARAVVPRDTGKFGELLNLLNPASPEDAALIAALFATPFWGGGPGERPLFIIEGEEHDPGAGRGVGKTFLVDTLAALCGGYFDAHGFRNEETLAAAIANNNTGATRLLRIDNVKAATFSSSSLESFVTSKEIVGRRNYAGQMRVKNLFTVVVTFNEAQTSSDIATRAIRIRLKRPECYSAAWIDRVRHLVTTERDLVVADILDVLAAMPENEADVETPQGFRFPAWAREVLTKVAPRDIFARIAKDASQMDASRAEAEADLQRIVDSVYHRLAQYQPDEAAGLTERNVAIPATLLHAWLRTDMPKRIDEERVRKTIERSDGRIRWHKSNGARFYLWTAEPQNPAYLRISQNEGYLFATRRFLTVRAQTGDGAN